MAAPVVTFVGTNLTLAESVTNWAALKISGTGGGPSASLDPDVFIQGSNSVSTIANKQRVWLYYDVGTASGALNFDAGGADFGRHIFMWVNFVTPGFSGTVSGAAANAIALGTDTSNYSYWNIHGNDSGYAGGWLRLVLNPTQPPTADVGSGVDTGAINFVGFIGDVLGNTARFQNLCVDRIDVGFGLQVAEGDEADPIT